MKTSLDHLPPGKQSKLRAIAKAIRDTVEVEMIIVFGSYARGDYVEDPAGGYISDVDLLVIVKNDRLVSRSAHWSQLRRQAGRIAGKADVSLLVHSIEDVNRQLEGGRYFFSDIKREGIVLHDAGRFALAEEKPPSPAERQAFARACFERYAERADRRYGLFETALNNEWYNEAAFELHQVAESCYKAVQLVFTAYLPKSHKLEALGKKCGDLHPAFRDVFPTATPEDRGRFELLEAAYVDARYSMTYAISRADLDTLAAHVRELRARVERVCLERIAAMAPG